MGAGAEVYNLKSIRFNLGIDSSSCGVRHLIQTNVLVLDILILVLLARVASITPVQSENSNTTV